MYLDVVVGYLMVEVVECRFVFCKLLDEAFREVADP